MLLGADACQKETPAPTPIVAPTLIPTPSLPPTPIPTSTLTPPTDISKLAESVVVPDFSTELAVDVGVLEGLDLSVFVAETEEIDSEANVLPELEAEIPSLSELSEASIDLGDLLGVGGP